MTELLLIRHGETDFNRERRFQGQVDVPLNPFGLRQAERLAAQLAREGIDALHCSDLLRTRQTAGPAAAALALPALADARLREQHFGILEGLTFDEVQARHAEPFERWARFDARYALPGGGESTHDFHRRAVEAIRDIAARHAGGRVAVVTHGGVLDMVWRAVHGLPLDGPRACLIPNAGLSRLRVVAERLEIVGWGEDIPVGAASVSTSDPKVINFKQSSSVTDNFKVRASAVPPTGSCQPSSSLSVLVSGTNVVAYVPKGNWAVTPTTGIGSRTWKAHLVVRPAALTAPRGHSCASNSLSADGVHGQQYHIYLLSGTSITNTLTSGGSGVIGFSGGFCTNCGVGGGRPAGAPGGLASRLPEIG